MNYLELPLNCYSEGHTPDYSLYSNLEVNGVMTFRLNDGEHFEPIFDSEEAPIDKRGLFFTIYGRFKTGHVEALHDASSITITTYIAQKITEQNASLEDVQIYWK
ncbi:hypothetical protein [Pseudoalteromonas luteoviolacea]|uniref:hypothetical protein n=1 Tax=Pseudoalteromonas luteoviolacea TaxID=43657 RepID=UPI001B379624|nr:hypothetical protein [Pseudoalteromonas luteoviolacea]MBQ4839782.1 hypothetical protein [Pseudoalteromonas luteoviolacea]